MSSVFGQNSRDEGIWKNRSLLRYAIGIAALVTGLNAFSGSMGTWRKLINNEALETLQVVELGFGILLFGTGFALFFRPKLGTKLLVTVFLFIALFAISLFIPLLFPPEANQAP